MPTVDEVVEEILVLEKASRDARKAARGAAKADRARASSSSSSSTGPDEDAASDMSPEEYDDDDAKGLDIDGDPDPDPFVLSDEQVEVLLNGIADFRVSADAGDYDEDDHDAFEAFIRNLEIREGVWNSMIWGTERALLL